MPALPLHIPPRRADIVAEARSWIGTPWLHHQHTKGVGTDCIGFVVETLRLFVYAPDFEYPPYSPMARPGQLVGHVSRYLLPIEKADIQPGDAVLMKLKYTPTHLALAADWVHGGLSIIHTDRSHGRVIEVPFGGALANELFVSAWRVPGVV